MDKNVLTYADIVTPSDEEQARRYYQRAYVERRIDHAMPYERWFKYNWPQVKDWFEKEGKEVR